MIRLRLGSWGDQLQQAINGCVLRPVWAQFLANSRVVETSRTSCDTEERVMRLCYAKTSISARKIVQTTDSQVLYNLPLEEEGGGRNWIRTCVLGILLLSHTCLFRAL